MPDKKKATSGQLVAGGAEHTNGNGAQSHHSTIWAVGSQAIWRNVDHDEPVVIAGLAGEHQGERYWLIEGSSTGIPESELHQPEPAASMVAELQALLAEAKVEPPATAASEQAARAERALLAEGAHDEGNAQATHLRYQGRFCHNEAFGWLQHVGSHWTIGGAEAATERAITETLIARIDAALKSGAADKHGELIKRCIPSASRVQGAKAQLKSLVYVSEDSFDRDPNLLNTPTGVVDLRSGHLSPHSPDQRFTHCTSVPYEPGADQSAWLKWLIGAVGAEQAAWLQLAVGYSITGHTREEVLFYLYGPPRAGKGLFTETLLAVLGKPLATEINFSTFTAQRTGDSQNFDLAPLKPCRLVAASESNSYERFNEAKLKALTGGNEVYCAFKHHTHFSYRPQFKIWLSSNEPVNADPDDEAVWGRLRVIEFPHSHLGAENKLLKEKMRSPAVLTGVLAWAVAGAARWYELGAAGLPELATSSNLKQQQRAEIDAVGAWLDECCLQADGQQAPKGSFTSSSDLYSNYESWCRRSGVEPKKAKSFGQSLAKKGYKPDRDNTGARGFRGLKLKP